MDFFVWAGNAVGFSEASDVIAVDLSSKEGSSSLTFQHKFHNVKIVLHPTLTSVRFFFSLFQNFFFCFFSGLMTTVVKRAVAFSSHDKYSVKMELERLDFVPVVFYCSSELFVCQVSFLINYVHFYFIFNTSWMLSSGVFERSIPA